MSFFSDITHLGRAIDPFQDNDTPAMPAATSGDWFDQQAQAMGGQNWDQVAAQAGQAVQAAVQAPDWGSNAQQLGQAAPAGPSVGNQSWLGWINNAYGQSASRGGGFADLPSGTSLQQVVDRYNQETGGHAVYGAGPSGDRVDFGRGMEDVLTSGGQLWQANDPSNPSNAQAPSAPAGGGGGAAAGSSGGSWSGSGGFTGTLPTMPTAPVLQQLGAAPQFQGPAAYQLPDAFQGPAALNAPDRTTYTAQNAPTAFAGSRQSAPAALSYQGLATPADFQYDSYKGPSEADMLADPSYKFRLAAGQDALQNSRAASGNFSGGNTAKALVDYGQGAASQEYAAIDQRARTTNQINNAGRLSAAQTNNQTGLAYNQNANQNALQFGQQNIQNAYNANEANYGRSASEAQQGFQNQFNVNAANNAGAAGAAAANNQSALAFQGQNYSQAANTYGMNQQAAQSAQQQNYAQQLGAYQANTGNTLAYANANNQNALNLYGQQTNAALGLGNLGLGYQNSGQNYDLGMTQAANNYNLGLGNLGVSQGQLGLAQQGQQFNQATQTYDRNYAATTYNPNTWDLQRAQLGNPGTPNTGAYGSGGAGTIENNANAQAAAQLYAAQQQGNLAANLTNLGTQQLGQLYPQQPSGNYMNGTGQPMWAY